MDNQISYFFLSQPGLTVHYLAFTIPSNTGHTASEIFNLATIFLY
jgi:hypothetical protein